MTEDTSASQAQQNASDETSAKRSIVKSVYARKVRVALTRGDAEMLRRILVRLTGDSVARAAVGMPPTPKSSMQQAMRMHRLVDKGIVVRDKAMAKKLGHPPPDGDVEIVMDHKLYRERKIIDAPLAPDEKEIPLF